MRANISNMPFWGALIPKWTVKLPKRQLKRVLAGLTCFSMDFGKPARRLTGLISKRSSHDCLMITSKQKFRYFFNYPAEPFERFCSGLVSSNASMRALVTPKLDEAKTEKSSAGNIFTWTGWEGKGNSLTMALGSVGARSGDRAGSSRALPG
ncbi:MAG: hypothetical protein ACREBS_10785 [Nitrososphaerales archaeon]